MPKKRRLRDVEIYKEACSQSGGQKQTQHKGFGSIHKGPVKFEFAFPMAYQNSIFTRSLGGGFLGRESEQCQTTGAAACNVQCDQLSRPEIRSFQQKCGLRQGGGGNGQPEGS